MANLEDDKLIIKVVYYGPALSGKTTNLIALHEQVHSQFKGDMMVLDTDNDRTLFFDLLPLGFRSDSGLLVKCKLFTVPGQVIHDSTRKAVLSGADGVVFVADSQTSQRVNNAEAFENLEINAAQVGLDFDSLPLVIQFNKRDLDNILSEEDVLQRWQPTPWTVIFSSALTGSGVMKTFSALIDQVYQRLNRDMCLQSSYGIEEVDFSHGLLQYFDYEE